MAEGVTIFRPDTCVIDSEVTVGPDTVIEPYVQLLGSTRIGSDCRIRSYSVIHNSVLADNVTVRNGCILDGANVGDAAILGPYSHLRPESNIGPEAHVGNFCETKKVTLGRGSKANHLTYLGDAVIGSGSNIGAGVITCNYDGVHKHTTTIGDGAFRRIRLHPGRPHQSLATAAAYVGAGSCITQPGLAAGALAHRPFAAGHQGRLGRRALAPPANAEAQALACAFETTTSQARNPSFTLCCPPSGIAVAASRGFAAMYHRKHLRALRESPGSAVASSTTAPSRTTLSATITVPGFDNFNAQIQIRRHVLLVRIDKHHVERLRVLIHQRRKRVRRRPQAQLNSVREPGPRYIGQRDLGMLRLNLQRYQTPVWKAAPVPSRSCCTRRACQSPGFAGPPWTAPARVATCPDSEPHRSKAGLRRYSLPEPLPAPHRRPPASG